MMVWNRWSPLQYGHFGIHVRFLGSKIRWAFVPNSKYWRLPRALLPILAMASHTWHEAPGQKKHLTWNLFKNSANKAEVGFVVSVFWNRMVFIIYIAGEFVHFKVFLPRKVYNHLHNTIAVKQTVLGVTDLTWILWDHKCFLPKNNSSQIHFQQLWQSFHDNQDSCHHIMVAKFLTGRFQVDAYIPNVTCIPRIPTGYVSDVRRGKTMGVICITWKNNYGKQPCLRSDSYIGQQKENEDFHDGKFLLFFRSASKTINHPAKKQSYLRVLSKTHEKQWIIYAFPSWRITPL